MLSNRVDDILKNSESNIPIIYFINEGSDPYLMLLKYCRENKIQKV
jgi:hypothetical protein